MINDKSDTSKQSVLNESSPFSISDEQRRLLAEYDEKEKLRLKSGKNTSLAQVCLAILMVLLFALWSSDQDRVLNSTVVVPVLIGLFFANIAILMLRLRMTGIYGKGLDKSKIIWNTSTDEQKNNTLRLGIILLILIFLPAMIFLVIGINAAQNDKKIAEDFDKKILEERRSNTQKNPTTKEFKSETIGLRFSYPSSWGEVVNPDVPTPSNSDSDVYWYSEFSSVEKGSLRLSGANAGFTNKNGIDDVLFVNGFDYNLFKESAPNCPEKYQLSSQTTCALLDKNTLVYMSDVLRTGFKVPNYYIVRNLDEPKSGLGAIRLAYFGYAEIDGYPEHTFIISKDEFLNIASNFTE